MDGISRDNVIIERKGTAGLIRLDRPKALNSLTLPMVRAIATAMELFASDASIATVIIAGEGERGLCAGGDIKMFYESGKSDPEEALTFWREEFRLNARIATYPKPYIALMDGITMGGGVGISAHGSHRIVTERTRLAMPETGIGYFPDVGATWLLSHAPGETGTLLGLSGLAIGAADAIDAGLADHMVSSASLPVLVEAIAALPAPATHAAVIATMAQFVGDAPAGKFAGNRAWIDLVFSGGSVTSILDALKAEPSEFAKELLATIESRSPTSLKLTLRLLREGRASQTLGQCLEREFAVCHEILNCSDFYEGIRAAVIDKDRNPRWQPATLGEVSDAEIDRLAAAAKHSLFEQD